MSPERFQQIKTQAQLLVRTVQAVAGAIHENGAISGGLLYATLLAKGIVDGIPAFTKLMQLVTAGGTIVKDGAHYRVATIAEVEAFDKGILAELGEGSIDLVRHMQRRGRCRREGE